MDYLECDKLKWKLTMSYDLSPYLLLLPVWIFLFLSFPEKKQSRKVATGLAASTKYSFFLNASKSNAPLTRPTVLQEYFSLLFLLPTAAESLLKV
jgi:hypothetical protein